MHNYDPRMAHSGNTARQRVTVTFQQGSYSTELSTTVLGDCTGALVMERAVSRIYRDLIEETGMATITLEGADGNHLVIGDDENRGECFIKDIAVSAEIILLD